MRVLAPAIGRVLGSVALLASVACPSAPVDAGQARTPRPGGSRPALTRADALSMRDKMTAMDRFGAVLAASRRPGAPVPSRTIVVTEREVNAYLAFDPDARVPVGIAHPYISILGGQRLSGTALLDLDAVRVQHRSRSWFDPLRYLSGQLPLVVSGRLSTKGGRGWFAYESASLSGIPIPKSLLQELLTYHSRTPELPQGIGLDDPFPLPSAIRQIDVGRRGEAIVIQ